METLTINAYWCSQNIYFNLVCRCINKYLCNKQRIHAQQLIFVAQLIAYPTPGEVPQTKYHAGGRQESDLVEKLRAVATGIVPLSLNVTYNEINATGYCKIC